MKHDLKLAIDLTIWVAASGIGACQATLLRGKLQAGRLQILVAHFLRGGIADSDSPASIDSLKHQVKAWTQNWLMEPLGGPLVNKDHRAKLLPAKKLFPRRVNRFNQAKECHHFELPPLSKPDQGDRCLAAPKDCVEFSRRLFAAHSSF
jgi:hypothetical protein